MYALLPPGDLFLTHDDRSKRPNKDTGNVHKVAHIRYLVGGTLTNGHRFDAFVRELFMTPVLLVG